MMLKLCVWPLRHFSNFLKFFTVILWLHYYKIVCLSPDKHTEENDDSAEKGTCSEMV